MNQRLARSLARLGALLLPFAALAPATATASSVDPYSGYQPQESCTSVPKPGTEYLLDWLVRHYPHTGSSGTLRPCGSGGQSEHKDGRALDWAVDADDPAQAAQAEAFLARAFATDRAGNPDALARRMGIMYVIWDDHIYSAYSGGFEKRDYTTTICAKPRNCSKTTRHRDHVHISLSYAGAAAQTSFYRDRGVPSIPVLEPGTRRLDPTGTAVYRVQVPANGDTVRPGFTLSRGTTYRIVGDGLYRYGPGSKVADAACRWSADGWTGSDTGLLVNGSAPWATDCDGSHTHETLYTPRRTGLLTLSIGDPHPRGNAGSLTFYVLREDLPARSVAWRPEVARHEPRAARSAGPSGKRLRKETVTVRASSRRGTLTDRALRRHGKYRVVVTGLARSGADVFDGNCVRYAGRYRAQHSLDLTTPAADHLSLYISGVRVNLRVPGSAAACDRSEHRYVGTFRAVVRGKARVAVWDPFAYSDNSGALTVTLKRRR